MHSDLECRQTGIDYFVDGVMSRIEEKAASGSRLTSVERHLKRSARKLRGGCLAPSLFGCLGSTAATLARPLALGLIAAFIVAAEGRSVAWFQNDWDWTNSVSVVEDSGSDEILAQKVEQLAKLAL